MSGLFEKGQKQETAGTAAPVQKYAYKVCPKTWNPRDRKFDGCGKYFTMDSVLGYCPDCGKPLSVVIKTDPVTEDVSRVHMEKCEKCGHNTLSPPCFCDKPPKPEYCRVCPCYQCCVKARKMADALASGKVRWADAVREVVRERKEREAKEREAEADDKATVETKAGVEPAKPVARADSMYKPIGAILDEMPF